MPQDRLQLKASTDVAGKNESVTFMNRLQLKASNESITKPHESANESITKPHESANDLHKVLLVCEDSGEDSKQHASKQTEH